MVIVLVKQSFTQLYNQMCLTWAVLAMWYFVMSPHSSSLHFTNYFFETGAFIRIMIFVVTAKFFISQSNIIIIIILNVSELIKSNIFNILNFAYTNLSNYQILKPSCDDFDSIIKQKQKKNIRRRLYSERELTFFHFHKIYDTHMMQWILLHSWTAHTQTMMLMVKLWVMLI